MKRRKEITGTMRVFALVLIGLIVVTIWATTRAATNAVYEVPRLIESGNNTNRAFIRNDTLFTDSMAVSVHNIVRALNKIEADTLEGSGTIMGIGSDTTFFDIDSSGANVVLWFGGHGAAIKWQRSTDSLYWTIDGTTWTSFGTGSGGSGTDTDQDSTFVVHYSSRWAPLPDSNVQYFGNITDSAIFLIDRDDDYAVFYAPLYKFDPTVSDSEYITRAEANTLTGSTGDIEGVTAGIGLSGGGTSGTVTLNILWTWLHAYIDSSSAKIPTATLADSSVKQDTANTLNWTEARQEIKNGAEIYNKIDTTAAKIPTATLADSTNGGAARATTAVTADTTAGGAARATRAAVADSAVKGDTAVVVDWTELRAEIKNGAENYNKIDTTTAKIPTATLADSSAGGSARATRAAVADSAVKGDTASVVDWTELRTEIKNGAENYNKIDTTTAKIPTATLADSTNGGAARAETAKSVIANSIDSTEIIDGGIGSGDIGTGRITGTHILDGTVAAADIATGGVATEEILDQTVKAADVDSTTADEFVIPYLRVKNNLDADTINNGNYFTAGGGEIVYGGGVTRDTMIQPLWPVYDGGQIFRGFGLDTFQVMGDTVTLWDRPDEYGQSFLFDHRIDTTNSVNRVRMIQIAVPVPFGADSIYRVEVGVKNGQTWFDSTFLCARWNTTDFCSTSTLMTQGFMAKDSTSSATYDTLILANKQAVNQGETIWVLLTFRTYDKHVTYGRFYFVNVVWRMRYM